MGDGGIDILVITYNREEYTKLSLPRLLDTCDESMRVWIWQNGNHRDTIQVVKAVENHPRVHNVHYNTTNIGQREPTRWLWENSTGSYVSKVDDDILLPLGWAQKLRQAHQDVAKFGIIGCWHFQESDFVPEIADKKIRAFPQGHRLMVNCWLGGSGYLLKKEIIQEFGFWQRDENFSDYGIRLALNGFVNGWYFPFIYQHHMDDPRSEYTILRTESDFQANPPATAVNFGIRSLSEWKKRMEVSALKLQKASTNPINHLGARRKLKWWLGLYGKPPHRKFPAP